MHMAQEDGGRPLHSAGTDGVPSSAPASRSNQSHASPSRERRATNSTYKNGDGNDFPRYFLQLGQDNKRTRGYEMIQELQLMVCNKESGIKGNKARARVMVLLREVQGVLISLENKVDAQTYDLGVFNVERSELRKELRDQKAKEYQPLHTIDFRSTEVKDLPHKLRALFEDNQILRDQVRQLQYSVRSAESRLEASDRRGAALEEENAQLCIALREAGSSAEIAHDMRQMREAARSAETRAMQLEMQLMSLTEQLELERRVSIQKQRHAAARYALLESRLNAALGPAARLGASVSTGGAIRKSSARSAVNMYDPLGVDDGGSICGRFGDVGGGVGTGGGSAYGASSLLDGMPGAGGGGGGGGVDGRSSAHSRVHSVTSAGGAGRSSAGRDRSDSPPRSPSGRSISHSPGSAIPTLYPLFNAKPRAAHAFSADSPTWLVGTGPAVAGGTAGGGAGSGGGSGSPIGGGTTAPGGSLSSSPLPPPPSLVRNPSLTDRPVGPHTGGPTGRPSSGSLAAMEGPQDVRPPSSASTSASSPGELVRALNSSAVVTSRTLLPSVSGASGGGGSGARTSGAGILGLRVGAVGGGGGGSVLRRSTGSDDVPLGGGGGFGTRAGGGGAASGGSFESATYDLVTRGYPPAPEASLGELEVGGRSAAEEAASEGPMP